MPRPIFTPLSGRDRMHYKQQLRLARGEYHAKIAEALQARAAAERYRLAADKAFCAKLGTQRCSQAGRPNRAGFGDLVVKCSRCGRESILPLASIKRPPETDLWKLEAPLNCEPCRRATQGRVQAYIIGLRCNTPGAPGPAAASQAS